MKGQRVGYIRVSSVDQNIHRQLELQGRMYIIIHSNDDISPVLRHFLIINE